MALVFRPARPEDALAIARVQIATWRSTYRGLVPGDFLDKMEEKPRVAYWRELITRDTGAAERAFIVVAEDTEGGVVGFAVGGPDRGGDPDYRGELAAIYILKEYQGRGAGRSLVREVAQELLRRGYQRMLVWVLAKNPYRRFYEALGGRRLRSATITVGGATLEQWAYGWDDLRRLAGPAGTRPDSSAGKT